MIYVTVYVVRSRRQAIMQERPYGKTGEKLPILSFGAQRIVENEGVSETDAIKTLNYALDHGIRCFDTAWVYSGGESEERVGKVAKQRRKEMWLAAQENAAEGTGAR